MFMTRFYWILLQVTKRDLLLSARTIYLIGREKVSSGPEKGQIKDVVKRMIPVAKVQSISLRYTFNKTIIFGDPSPHPPSQKRYTKYLKNIEAFLCLPPP